MTLAATVLVPTHDHGPTLLRSVRSALAQTVEALEVLVVGDGVPDTTRMVMQELLTSDPRVKFLDLPKGPRHGELHRHAALQEAQGEIVCYLSDDDLWLPDHVAEMQSLLAESDFAHALPCLIDGQSRIQHFRVDLSLEYYRELLLAGENRIPLSCGAHTVELYRRLPHGWRTTPADTFTDLYMWQQILLVQGCRATSGKRPTVLHLPSSAREDRSDEQRLAELDRWSERLSDATFPHELAEQLVGVIATESAGLEEHLRITERELGGVQAQFAEANSDRARLIARLHAVDKERLHDQQSFAARLGQLERELTELSLSVTWRLRTRIVSLPGLGRVLRWAARALAGGEDPVEIDRSRPAPIPEQTAPARGSAAPDPPNDTRARHSDPSIR